MIQGTWYDTFVELANLAGAMVPSWPETPYPNLLADMGQWQQSLPGRREIAGQPRPWFDKIRDGTDSSRQDFPAWVRLGLSSRLDRLVTDHRNHAERWVALVYTALKIRDPDSFRVQVLPESAGHGINPWNCLVTLGELNLFEASARVIGWLLPEMSEVAALVGPASPECDDQEARAPTASDEAESDDVQAVERLIVLTGRILSSEPGRPRDDLARELNRCRDDALGVKTQAFLPFERWREMIRSLDSALRPLLSIPANHPELWTCRQAVQEPLQRVADVIPRLRAEHGEQNRGGSPAVTVVAERPTTSEVTLTENVGSVRSSATNGTNAPPTDPADPSELAPAVLAALKQKWDAISRSQSTDKLLCADSSDPEIYDWLKEEGELVLAKRDTWLKYQQRARKFLGQPKTSPVGGRPAGKTIVRESELDQHETE